MDYLIAGERNPKVLPQPAGARVRRKIAEPEAALAGPGFFAAEQRYETVPNGSALA